jgi:alpha-tubulin suppressor-like RCC1 family protein
VEGSEECDDGNTIAADGCEPDCKRSKLVQLVAGLAHTCALLREGLVRCWGNNDQGQLGLGHTTNLSVQKPYQNGLVQLGAPAVALVAGGEHTCALMQDASVRCWGKNGFGQLGLGHTQPIGDNEIPNAAVATVPLGASAIDITAGGDVTCALLEGGALRCWGHNNYGQLGLGHTRDIGDDELPSAALAGVPLDDTVRAVGTGGNHTCVVLDSNETRCWGRNDFGQLGIGSTEQIGDNELPTAVPAVVWTDYPQFGAIQPSVTRTYALCANGYEVRAWGANDDGGLGVRYTGSSPELLPTQYGSLMFNSSTLGIAVGGYHACAWLQQNELRCWGINNKAQLGLANTETLGDNEPITSVSAIVLGLDSTGKAAYAITAAAGGAHTCALLNSGIVLCWGANEKGQLGLGYVGGPSGRDYVGGTAATIPALLDPVLVFGPAN